ncbi:MAG TPA: hypothetical protein PLA50_19920 [Bacteroidia bacterium]|nr:hypothetical protein [Bacteroidia bacterium]
MRTLPSLLALSLSAFLLASCATNPVEKRITKYPEMYGKLSQRHRELVQSGQIAEGMTTDAVFLAWGRPGRVMSGSRDGRGQERWAYFHNAPVQTVSFGVSNYGYHPFYSSFGFHPAYGYGYGPGWGYGTNVDFVPYLDRTVEFSNGKVVSWERLR